MSNTPKPQANTLDEILDGVFAYGIDWTEHKDKSEHDHEVSTFAGKIKDELKETAKQQIQALITEEVEQAVMQRDREWIKTAEMVNNSQLKENK